MRVLRLLVLGASLLGAPAWALPERTWVLALGNNHGDADEVSLLYAERDVREIVDVLRTHGGVSSTRVRVLVDEDAGTVRRVIQDTNAEIRARSDDGRTPTALLIFYSGHADADSLHLRGTRLAFDELRSLVAGSPASMRLLVVDACRSGALTRVKGAAAAKSFDIQMEDKVEAAGMALISSSAAGESSQESDRLRASFFSHHLVNALRGAADRNADGKVTLTEAYAYAYAQTLRSSGQTMTLQHPTYSYDVKGRGDLVLTSIVEDARRTGRLRLGEPGIYLVAEEREGGPVVAELSPPHQRAVVALPGGRYFVQQRGGAEYREYKLRLGAGEELDLQAQPYRAVRYDQLVRKRGGDRLYTHGLSIQAGGRGEALAGEGVTPQLLLGYSLDLPWLTAGLRVRGSTVNADGMAGGLPRRHSEVGVGLVLQRYVDLTWVSLSFGLVIEGIYHAQSFDAGTSEAPARGTLGVSFAGLIAFERQLWRGLALRVEGGPAALAYPRSVLDHGAQVRTELGSAFTWWVAGGPIWRL